MNIVEMRHGTDEIKGASVLILSVSLRKGQPGPPLLDG